MTLFLVSLLSFLAIVGHSNGAFCVCKDGAGDLQKTIDYACANGADCTAINQGGPCYNPNTVKDHCSWAVNSYYQKKGQTPLSCDFAGTATVTSASPSQSSSCVYPSGSGNGGSVGTPTTGTPTTGTPPSTGTPTTYTPPSTGTPTTYTPPSTGTPTTGTPSSSTFTPPGTGTGMGTPSPITTIPQTTPGGYGLGPSGVGGVGSPDSSGAARLDHTANLTIAISLLVFALGLMFTSP